MFAKSNSAFFFVLSLMASLSLGVASNVLSQSGSPPSRSPLNQPVEYGAPVATEFTSKIGFIDMHPMPGASYPRVIQIAHYAAAKGDLLATFSRRTLPIYRS